MMFVRPCSEAEIAFSSGLPRLTSAMVSFWAYPSCQRPTSCNIAVQGPQFGSVNSRITGLPGARNASKVSRWPWRFGRSKSGAAVSPPDHEAGNGGEDPVAHKGLPAGGFGVQLPEAMALRLAATGQIGADPNDEQEQ